LARHTLLADYIVTGGVSAIEDVSESVSAERHRRTIRREAVNAPVTTMHAGVYHAWEKRIN